MLPTKYGEGVVFVGDAPESRGLEQVLTRLSATHPFGYGSHRASTRASRRAATSHATPSSRELGTPAASFEAASRPQTTSLARIQQTVFEEGGQDRPSALDDSVQFLSAPGESLEAVEIARLDARGGARGVQFQEMAVLMRSPSACAGHLALRIRSSRHFRHSSWTACPESIPPRTVGVRCSTFLTPISIAHKCGGVSDHRPRLHAATCWALTRASARRVGIVCRPEPASSEVLTRGGRGSTRRGRVPKSVSSRTKSP